LQGRRGVRDLDPRPFPPHAGALSAKRPRPGGAEQESAFAALIQNGVDLDSVADGVSGEDGKEARPSLAAAVSDEDDTNPYRPGKGP
jgi:hypothetical protein